MRVLLADGHPLVLAGLRALLDADGGFEVVAEATHGSEVLSLIAQSRPDTVLLAMSMAGVDSIACLDRIRAVHPSVDVVLFVGRPDALRIHTALRHGACGVLLKTINPRDLPSAIRQAVDRTAFNAFGVPATFDAAGLS